MLTANMHHPNGYLENSCKQDYLDQYSNVIACTSNQIYQFIKWIQKQDFYDNTTIVISGDHLSMHANYFNSLSDDFQRTVFNLFINSAIETSNTYNRQFAVIDLFPTTLASLGVKIEGNKLALGVNLFSDEKTLIEKYGYDYIDKELSYRSDFYNKRFIYNIK